MIPDDLPERIVQLEQQLAEAVRLLDELLVRCCHRPEGDVTSLGCQEYALVRRGSRPFCDAHKPDEPVKPHDQVEAVQWLLQYRATLV